ncbi:MAG: phenylalanine--tRNA ligase subunit beta [Aggregatilineales bacterium]
MRVPLSWLKDYVTITISAEELAERLTLAGLEVKALEYIGVPQGEAPIGITVPPSDHLVWARDKIVLGAIREVKPHPNADRLVLAMVDYGVGRLEQVVTGAPNLYPYKGKGELNPPLYAPLALEGAEVYDGHAEGRQRMILTEKSLRGIPNRAMVCSAKELGLGEDHEGIMLLEDVKAPIGTPLVEILGDVIFEIDLTPNMARAYGILGVAREVAALTGQTLREPSYDYTPSEAPSEQFFSVEIRDSVLNPRFCAILIRDVQIGPSPSWLRRRLEAVGVRSINNIVDVTNYVMFELGQPMHAFDYDVLLRRSGGAPPRIITRRAEPGEVLETLDGVKRTLDDQTVLVCDSAGPLGLGGIMGGAESEIQPHTRNVLLEVASWNYINIRRTMSAQKMSSEAGVRFSRGVHPEQARRAIGRGAELMRALGGAQAHITRDVIDIYPTPVPEITVDLPLREVERNIGIALDAETVSSILRRLQFDVTQAGPVLHVRVPDHRVDISTGQIGIADLCEEIARIYGYDRIPDTLIEDALPDQAADEALTREERSRDILAQLGLREVINYRLTTPEAEARLIAPNTPPLDGANRYDYVRLANPISAERTVMRQTLLNGLLVNIAENLRHSAHLRLFEIGSVFLMRADSSLPDEPRRLAIALCGTRELSSWQRGEVTPKNAPLMDFYDLKGILEALCQSLRLSGGVKALSFKAEDYPTYFPGRCAALYLRGERIGFMGEVHPLVRARYEISLPVIACELDFEALTAEIPLIDRIQPIPTTPPVYEDIALVVSESVTAAELETVIRAAGGELLREVRLFDVYRGAPLPEGKKSLAYALTYQSDRTLTDKEVATVRAKIIKAAENQLNAVLRA